MPILHETTYDVTAGQFDKFQKWLLGHEDALAAAYPEGVEYLGTYANVYGIQAKGEFKTVLRLDDYAALDTLAATMAQEGTLSRLLWEVSAFTTGGASSRGHQELWKRVSVTVPGGD
jgi:hypothetical protein